jgi:hypothetical protein
LAMARSVARLHSPVARILDTASIVQQTDRAGGSIPAVMIE